MAAVMAAPVSPARTFDFDYRSPARMQASPLPGCAGCSDELEETCTKSQMRTAQWRKEHSQSLQQEVQHGLHGIWREEEALQELEADLVAVQELTETARRFRAEASELGEVMLQSINAGQRRAEVATRTRDYLRGAQEKCLQEVRQEQQRLQEWKQDAGSQLKDIDAFLSRYSRSLGFEISRVAPQTVRLCFTLLDAAEPCREFSLVLSLAGGADGYGARDCSPKVPELDVLLERLNEDPSSASALPAFVCGLRRAFKQASR
eukprot:TRINITY_DN85406_c0_g1_i1.p1 TRINITY_DN85406_c0_g1~~TRINITY_DN85406_c0_g1_i1.p1  ORF type:complete len:262 (-),score=71.47 TRINITY_DN85406_c0_g1_i1:36-821(-)